jgi:Ser/Thr protein kinase RdoA (MazF antagonist)
MGAQEFARLSAAEQEARLARMAQAAVALWPIACRRIEAIKVRENAVYAVHTEGGGRVALRIHRQGYHGEDALRSEFAWMQALQDQGIEVPRPVLSRAGREFELVEHEGVNGPRQVDVFEWVEGRQLGSVGDVASEDEAWIVRTYAVVGELAARMHNQSSAWQAPAGFMRHRWDAEGLAGETPLWGRFWELEALTRDERALLVELRDCLREDLGAFGTSADRHGLIHADLVPENVLLHGERLRVIDFDDAGFGWHLFDAATSLYFIRRKPFFALAHDAFIAGYRMHRPLPDDQLRHLPMFLAARGTTYLGWVHTRRGEATAEELTPHLVELAVAAARDYLKARP